MTGDPLQLCCRKGDSPGDDGSPLDPRYRQIAPDGERAFGVGYGQFHAPGLAPFIVEGPRQHRRTDPHRIEQVAGMAPIGIDAQGQILQLLLHAQIDVIVPFGLGGGFARGRPCAGGAGQQ